MLPFLGGPVLCISASSVLGYRQLSSQRFLTAGDAVLAAPSFPEAPGPGPRL